MKWGRLRFYYFKKRKLSKFSSQTSFIEDNEHKKNIYITLTLFSILMDIQKHLMVMFTLILVANFIHVKPVQTFLVLYL